MNRLIPMSGVLAVGSGAAWLVPAFAARMEHGGLATQEWLIASVGVLMMLCGVIAISRTLRDLRQVAALPSAVRIAIIGNGLFVMFCVLEFSDGFLRQNGRMFYWTTFLFLPALALFYGQVLPRRWAWWGTRIVTANFALWFTVFLLLIPFAHLRGNGGAAPWWGKVYAECVTLVFFACSAGVFCSLSGPEAKEFFGAQREPQQQIKESYEH